MKRRTPNRKFNLFALALALSAGTIGGMASFAGMTEPAFAGGNSQQGQIAKIEVSRIDTAKTDVAKPDAVRTVALKTEAPHCGGDRDANTRHCVPSYRPVPRVVNINGFANCSKVQQVVSTNGQPAKFECARPM